MGVKMREIDLEVADLKFSAPPPVIRELRKEISQINLYPSGDYLELKKAFCDYLGPKLGFGPENVVFGNGLDEIIDLISRVWGNVNLIPIPTFSQYGQAARRSNQRVIRIDMMKEGEYKLHFDERLLRKASLVWICNPNNPTGNLILREKIEEIIDNSAGMVAVDECYFEYTGETVVDLIKEYSNLIVLRSFSKNFGIAGLRLGAAISKPENIRRMEKVRQPFNVNRMAERAGLTVLKYKGEFKKIWEKVLRIGRKFAAEVDEIGYRTFDVNANFVLVDFFSEDKARRIIRELEEKGIRACPGWSEVDFDGKLNSCIRFAIGSENDMRSVLEVLKR